MKRALHSGAAIAGRGAGTKREFCYTESLYKIEKFKSFSLIFSEKLAFVWNFNLGKYELGETREINFKAAFKI